MFRALPPSAAPFTSKQIVNGFKALINPQREILRFSFELRRFHNVKHCFLYSSATAALTQLLQALHALHPEKNEVLVPAFTCNTIPSAVHRAGLKLRLCDIDPHSLDFNTENLRKELDSADKLLCVVSVHLFGVLSEVSIIRKILKDKGVFLIEDAAQALGSGGENGQLAGTLGDASILSFARGKPLSISGGGALITANPKIASQVKKQYDKLPDQNGLPIVNILNTLGLYFLINPRFFWIPKMIPFIKFGITPFDSTFKIEKITPFQAGLAFQWQNRLRFFMEKREVNAQKWKKLLNKDVKVKKIPYNLSLLRYPVFLKDRSQCKTVLAISEKNGMGLSATYTNIASALQHFGAKVESSQYPGALECQERLIALPTHCFVLESDFDTIVRILN